MTDSDLQISIEQDYPYLRDPVRRICEQFPGEYWRRLDAAAEYPTEFVQALTEHEYLGCLIPEEYGGSGLPLRAASVVLETIHSSGCNAAACHAQMYTMGTVLRHGSDEQKQEYLPKIASGELRAAGVRRHRTRDRLRYRPSCGRRRSATATPTSSTARRSGPAGRSTPT